MQVIAIITDITRTNSSFSVRCEYSAWLYLVQKLTYREIVSWLFLYQLSLITYWTICSDTWLVLDALFLSYFLGRLTDKDVVNWQCRHLSVFYGQYKQIYVNIITNNKYLTDNNLSIYISKCLNLDHITHLIYMSLYIYFFPSYINVAFIS